MDTPQPPARRARTLLFNVAGAVSLAAGLVAFAPPATPDASAAPLSSFTSTAITIPDDDDVDRVLEVSGLTGRIIDIDVRLNGVSHTFPDDLNIYLDSPNGSPVVLVSDAGGDDDVAGGTWTFDDNATAVPPNGDGFGTGAYRTVNHGGGDGSVPAGTTASGLGSFVGQDPNGSWTLRVVDDEDEDTGSIAGGYTLLIQTSTLCNTTGGAVPDNGTAGTQGLVLQFDTTASGIGSTMSDVDVVVFGMGLRDLDHLDAFVRAPNGDIAYLFSDVDDEDDHDDIALDLDDEGPGSVPDDPVRSGTWDPTNVGGADGLPAGFAGSPGATLSTVEDSTALGTWSVGIRDDDSDGPSQAIGGFCLDITAGNTGPTAAPAGDLTTNEDTALPITLPGSDPDVGQSLTYAVTAQPAQGTITQLAGANWQYTPPADFNNPPPAAALTFTYQVSDGSLSASNSGTIRVLPVNDAPVAPDQSRSTPEDTPLGVTLGSTDVDGGAPTFTVVVPPALGILSGTGADLTYTPTSDLNGSDAFTYQVSDGNGGVDTGVVSITVTAVDDAPTADADSYGTPEDVTLVVPAADGVLDGDDDGDPEATQGLTAVLDTDVSNGTLTLDADGGFTYVPDADFDGIDSFTYRADDGTGQSAPATVTIDVGAVNDGPTADDQSVTTDEDVAVAVTLTGGDAADDALTFEVASGPAHGSLAGSGADRTYTPDPDYSGPDSFTFTVSDGVEFATGTVSVTVDAVNDAPTGTADAYTTDEDVDLVVADPGVLGNDADVDGDVLEATLVDDVDHGTLALAPDGGFTYEPDPDFHGADSFTYEVSDLTAAPVGVITVTITVDPVNDAPVVDGEPFSTDEDTVLVVDGAGLLANDSDPDGNTLLASLGTTSPTSGDVTVDPDGGFTYVPDGDFHGVDTFSYFVNDGDGGNVEATATITVAPVNDAPVADDQSVSTSEGTPIGITLTGSDVDGDTLAFTVESGPAHGDLTGSGAGRTYTPGGDHNGSDEVTFLVSDGNGGSDTLTVAITVTPVNDDPVADDETFTVDEDTELTFPVADLLVGDTDADGDTLAVTSITTPTDAGLSVPGGLGGTPDVAHLVPDPDFNGSVTFDYQVSDGNGGTDTGSVTVTVAPVADAPVAVDDSYSTGEDDDLVVAVAAGVLDNDSDVDGDPLTAVLVDAPEHGTVSLGSTGGFTYQPDDDFVGTDTFTYTVTDGDRTDTGTVSVEVGPNENDAPVADDDSYSTDEDEALVVPAAGVLLGDTDADAGDVLSVTVASGGEPSSGALTLHGDGSFTYVPDVDFHGTDAFTYAVTDGDDTDTATVTIEVGSINDVPVSVVDGIAPGYVVDEDATLVVPAGGVLDNDTDPDGDPLTAALVTGAAHGTVTLDPDGSFTYVPDADYHGADSFTYLADDGRGEPGSVGTAALGPATQVLIDVVALADPPVAVDDTALVAAGSSVTIPVLDNDTDADGEELEVTTNSAPSRGATSCTATECTFSAPAGDAGGVVTFAYEVEDPGGATADATVSVTVLAAGEVPSTPTTPTTPTLGRTPAQPTVGGTSTLPRTGADASLWSFGAVLLGIGLCTTGTATLVRERVLVLRRRRS